MAMALIIAAMMQLGFISCESDYADSIYNQNQTEINDFIIDDDLEMD